MIILILHLVDVIWLDRTFSSDICRVWVLYKVVLARVMSLNHAARNWLTLYHDIVSITPRHKT